MKIVALGRTDWLYESIKAAAVSGHKIVLIGTCLAAKEYSKNERDFALLAKKLHCPFFCDAFINKQKYIDMVRKSGAEVAISVNWLTRIGNDMINQFPHGVINAHGGNLPRFTGNACANWAILTGEKNIVLTLHKMNTVIDGGPILLQRKFELSPRVYIKDVYDFYTRNIPKMFLECIIGIEKGNIKPKKQSSNPAVSLRCFPRLPVDGKINWNQPADYLSRLVHASAEPFSGAYSFMESSKLIIWRAHMERLPYPYLGVPGQVIEVRNNTGEVVVLTGNGLLVIEKAEFLKKRDKASRIIRSVRIRLGMNIEEDLVNLAKKTPGLRRDI
jgi:methionyl-tRNA formyltransferase